MNEGTSQTDVQSHERSPTQAARSRVVAALAHLEHGQRDAMEELRTELCSYVGHLRRDGLSREAALSNIRSLIAQPAFYPAQYHRMHCPDSREFHVLFIQN